MIFTLNRKELKNRAKNVLKRCYWKAFVITAILSFTTGIMGKVRFSFSNVDISTTFESANKFINKNGDVTSININAIMPYIIHAVIIGVLSVFAILALKIFISHPFEVGSAKFFTEAESGNDNLNSIIFSFQNGIYLKTVFTMFLRLLYVFLWSLLFFIPGIIKYYAYSMVPYIISDNPDLRADEVLKISNILTRKNKWKIFVLDLSFIGWFILGLFTFGIGIYFVLPYYHATKAELYINLRNNAIADALYRPEDFSVETPRISLEEEENNGED